MSWYLIVKLLHILAVIMVVGGMVARQLVRGLALKSSDLGNIATLTRAAGMIERTMVVPGSNAAMLLGIVLAIIMGWPIFGFLQGSDKNWLLVSNILLIGMLILIFSTMVPHARKTFGILDAALAKGQITPELTGALNDKRIQAFYHVEEAIVLVIAALMVLKPF